MNQLSRTFPRHPRSPGLAREAMRAWAAEHDQLLQDTVDIAALLLTELVTNACRHVRAAVGGEVTMRCHIRGDVVPARLRVEVDDADATLPTPRDAEPDAEGGRGLALVEALAAAWAAEPRPGGDGKTVWFELELPENPAHAFTARFAPRALPVPAYLASPDHPAAPNPEPRGTTRRTGPRRASSTRGRAAAGSGRRAGRVRRDAPPAGERRHRTAVTLG